MNWEKYWNHETGLQQTSVLRHPIEDRVLRTTSSGNSHVLQVFVRFSGEKENQISDSIHLFTNAIIQENPISEREYWESQGE